MMIDDLDKKILNLLQQNAKLTMKELAEKLGLTATPVFERIKRLERDGVIRGYVALIDPEKVGRGQTVFVNVRMPVYSAENIASFEKHISKLPQVLECYHLAGTIDYQLKVVVENIKEYDSFLLAIAKIRIVNVDSSVIVLHKVKQETSLPL
jgi:DNA-binding Lrp family transcriptional regulator